MSRVKRTGNEKQTREDLNGSKKIGRQLGRATLVKIDIELQAPP